MAKKYLPQYKDQNGVMQTLDVIAKYDALRRQIDTTYVDLASNQIITGIKNFAVRPTLLMNNIPSAYQRVEYLDNTQAQAYINTGLPVHMGWKYKIVFQQDDAVTYRNWGVFNQQSYNGGLNCSLTYATNNWMVRWETVNGQTRAVNLLTIDTQKHTLIINKGNVYLDNNYYGISAAHDDSVVSNYNAYLFTINPGGTTPTTNMKGKIYAYQVWDADGVMKQDLVPCYRKSDNTPGFYDVVHDAFLTNIGAGTFTAGPNIESSPFVVENDLADVAFSGDYADLINLPTPVVPGNGTLTLNSNSNQLGTFSANQTTNVTVDVSDFFYCTYDANGNGTTVTEINAAIAAHKVPVCWYNSHLYVYSGANGDYLYFSYTTNHNAYIVRIKTTDNKWSYDYDAFEFQYYKRPDKTTTNGGWGKKSAANVNNNYYLSEKLVYDTLVNIIQTATGDGNAVTSITSTTNADNDPIINVVKGATFLTSSDLANYVTGPSSSTANAIARYHSTSGKIIQDSGITIDDNDYLYLGMNKYIYMGDTKKASFRANANGAFIVGSYDKMYFRGNLQSNDSTSSSNGVVFTTGSVYPEATSGTSLGNSTNKWTTIYGTKLNNGADITIPTTGGTMALVGDIPDTSDFVTKSTAQTITGQKTIKGQTRIQGNAPASSADNTTNGFQFWKSTTTTYDKTTDDYLGLISPNDAGALGFYGRTALYFRPVITNGSVNTNYGVTMNSSGLFPGSTLMPLGTSSSPWGTVYANTITGVNVTTGGTTTNSSISMYNGTFSNVLSTNQLKITSTNMISHIEFARDGWNYIATKSGNTNGVFGFVAGGASPEGATTTLAILSNRFLPGLRDNVVDIGGSYSNTTYHFKDLYMKGQIKNGSYSYTLPSASGTLALENAIPSVGNGKLTLIAGSKNVDFYANQATGSDVSFEVTAADLGLDTAMHFIGVTSTTQPAAGNYVKTTIGSTTYYVSVTNTGTATEIAAQKGDILLINNTSKEYICTTAGTFGTNVFTEMGDESSYVLKTTTVTGDGALGGGGALSSNQTITHNELNTSGAKTTADIFKIKIDKYGHITEATTASATDLVSEYIKSAAVGNGAGGTASPNNKLTLTKQDGTTLDYEPNYSKLQSLVATDDLNNFKTAGIWYTVSSAVIAGMSNKPSGISSGECMLEVRPLGDTRYTYQIFTWKSGTTKAIYCRIQNNGTWGSWTTQPVGPATAPTTDRFVTWGTSGRDLKDSGYSASSFEAKFTDGSATIATISNSIVTLKAGVSQSGGAISNSSGTDITLAKVASTGAYSDLSGTPSIPTVNNATLTITQNTVSVGTFTANQATDVTIDITTPQVLRLL